jgi:hypothetical protein
MPTAQSNRPTKRTLIFLHSLWVAIHPSRVSTLGRDQRQMPTYHHVLGARLADLSRLGEPIQVPETRFLAVVLVQFPVEPTLMNRQGMVSDIQS